MAIKEFMSGSTLASKKYKFFGTDDLEEAKFYSASDVQIFHFNDGDKTYYVPVGLKDSVVARYTVKNIVSVDKNNNQLVLLHDGYTAKITVNFTYGVFTERIPGTAAYYTEYGYRVDSIEIDNGVNDNGFNKDITIKLYFLVWNGSKYYENKYITVTIPKNTNKISLSSLLTTLSSPTNRSYGNSTWYLTVVYSGDYETPDCECGIDGSDIPTSASKNKTSKTSFYFAPIQWKAYREL